MGRRVGFGSLPVLRDRGSCLCLGLLKLIPVLTPSRQKNDDASFMSNHSSRKDRSKYMLRRINHKTGEIEWRPRTFNKVVKTDQEVVPTNVTKQDSVAAPKKVRGRAKYKGLCINDRHISEHRYVMEQHLGRRLTTRECVHHKNHDKRDNRLENLEVIDVAEHTRMHRTGVPRSEAFKEKMRLEHRGEKSSLSKLKELQVVEIKRRLMAGETCASLARLCMVRENAIAHIKTGKNWRHIPWPKPKAVSFDIDFMI